jgi:hypothetical protein
LQPVQVVAIVPPSLIQTQPNDAPPLYALPVMSRWVRGVLVGLGLALTAVFAVAVLLNPYHDDGAPRRMETHRQIGLPECSFKNLTKLPCPSCGMTTSFALTVRGDPRAFQANCVGALLALVCLAVVPWSLASAWRGRTLGMQSAERWLIGLIVALLGLMVVRWGLVLGSIYWLGGAPPF